MQAGAAMGGFVSHAERIDAQKVRARSESFFDHFSQATLFWNSQSAGEQGHIVQAFTFELGMVELPSIRERVVYMLSQVDRTLAGRVAQGLGLSVPASVDPPLNVSVPADGDVRSFHPKSVKRTIATSPALSMANTVSGGIKTRKVAILIAEGSTMQRWPV